MPDRIIKESICTSDTLNQLSDFEERFWHRLIVNCDDYGRFDARPAILKGRLFPLMEGKTLKDMSNTLSKLASVGLVELYEVDGKPFLHVVTWDKYQRIRAKRSKFPEPDGTCCHLPSDDVKCPRNPIQSESNPNPIRNADAGNAPAGEDQPLQDQELAKQDQELAKVMNLYLNRVNALPSTYCIDELKSYTKLLGADVCCKAINIALDDKKASWSYIKGILSSYSRDGVRSLADVQEREARREAEKAAMEKRRSTLKPNQVVAGTFQNNKPIDTERLRNICERMG